MTGPNPILADVPPFRPGPTTATISAQTGIAAEKILKLSSNEAPLGPAPIVRAALRNLADSDDLHRYPDPDVADLRAAIGERVGVDPAQILVADGSSETWPALIRAFSRSGDGVVRVEPSQAGYSSVAWLAERTPQVVDIPHPYDLTASQVLAGVDSTSRLIFLSSPNNTTSRLISQDTLREIATGAPDTLVVVDEHYIEAALDYQRRSAVPLLGELPNLVVTRTFSKMYGLAALRVGYAIGPAKVIAEANKLRSVWAVSLAAECAAIAALEDVEHLQANIDATAAGREMLQRGIESLPGVDALPAAEGGFLLVRVDGQSGADVAAGLLEAGVIVRGDLVADAVRVSVGRAEENQRFLDALTSLLPARHRPRAAGVAGA